MGLMKKLTSALVASSLVFSLVGSAFAAYTPAAGEQAGTRMQKLGIIQGRDGNDLALNAEITRAELVTTIVRAFGKEEDAKLLKGSTIFPDIANHWASGNIAMAVALVEKAGSDPIGMPDGTFAPDAKLTPAQAVAFLMKFVGVKADPNKAWPANYLDVAVDKGLITAEDKAILAPMVNDNATRGLVFYVFDRAFYTYNLGGGETFYTKYVDQTAPELVVTEPAATTMDSKITITGKATGATEVKVGSTMVTLAADGSFSYDLSLPELKDYDVTVEARDLAGNKATESFTVTRTVGNAAKVEATLEAQLVKAGTEVALDIVVKDAEGNVIEDAAYDVEIEGEIGTYADGVFTAAAMPATGTITVTSGEATAAVIDVAVVAGDLAKIEVTGATSAKIGQAVSFTAKGFDAAGNEVAVDDVTWTSSKGGVIGVNTGEFAGTASGTVTVTAKVGTITGETNVTVYGDAAALAITAPTGLVANGKDTKTVSVKVLDASGAVVTNSAAEVTLSVSGTKIRLQDANAAAQTQLTAKAVNGVATFTLWSPTAADTDFIASTATLSATSGTLTGALASVSAAAPTVGSIKLVNTPAGATFEATGTLTVSAEILDVTGVKMPAPKNLTLTLTNSNTTSGNLTDNTVDFTAGNSAATGTASLTLNAVPGDIALTATSTDGYTIQGINLTTKIAGPAYKAVITTAPVDNTADKGEFAVKVAVQDSLGTTKTTEGNSTKVQVVAKHEDGVTTATGTADIANGVATVNFNTANANNLRKAGTWTFTTKVSTAAGADTIRYTADDTYLIAPDAVTAKVTPGAINKLANLKINGVVATATAYKLVANGAQTATVTVEWQDAYSNKVETATNAVTFKTTATPTAFSGLSTTGTTVNAVNGVATISITSGIAEITTDNVIQVEAKNADNVLYVGSNNAAVQALVQSQIVGAAAKLEDNTAVANQVAGKDFTVSFRVMDASPTARHVATDNGRSVSLEILDGSTVVGTQTTTTVDGVAKFTVNLTAAKATYTFKAKAMFNGAEAVAYAGTADGVDANLLPDAITVAAADPVSVVLVADLTSVETGTVLTNGLTPVAKDAFGNTVTGVTFAGINLTENGSTTLSRLAAGVAPAYTYTASNAAETVAIGDSDAKANVTVTATAKTFENLPVTATSVTTYIAGPSYQLKLVETPAAFVAGNNATIKVGVYDGAGNLNTKATNAITLAAPAGVTNPDTVLGGLTANAVNGIATFTVTGAEATGTYQLEASATGLVKASGINVVANAGAASKIVVNDVTGADALTANGSSIAILTFKVTDANGNVVPSYTGTMNFTTSGTGATLLSTSAPISNGQAVVQVKATTQSGTFEVTPSLATADSNITIETAGGKGSVATVTVKAGAPVAATSSVTLPGAGQDIILVLRDAFGNAVTGYSTALLVQVDAADAAQAGAFTEVGNGVYKATQAAGTTNVQVLSAPATVSFEK